SRSRCRETAASSYLPPKPSRLLNLAPGAQELPRLVPDSLAGHPVAIEERPALTGFAENVRHADPTHRHRVVLGGRGGDERADPGEHAVLLEDQDRPGVPRSAQERGRIERLHGGEVE